MTVIRILLFTELIRNSKWNVSCFWLFNIPIFHDINDTLKSANRIPFFCVSYLFVRRRKRGLIFFWGEPPSSISGFRFAHFIFYLLLKTGKNLKRQRAWMFYFKKTTGMRYFILSLHLPLIFFPAWIFFFKWGKNRDDNKVNENSAKWEKGRGGGEGKKLIVLRHLVPFYPYENY